MKPKSSDALKSMLEQIHSNFLSLERHVKQLESWKDVRVPTFIAWTNVSITDQNVPSIVVDAIRMKK